MRKHTPLLLILLLYLMLGTLYAAFTPAWQAPDEPAHYNYIRQLAQGSLPVIEPGDYDQAFIIEVVFESAFAPEYRLDILEYEDWQPPLYYLLQTPVYRLSDGNLLALRLVSVFLGAGVVVLAYAIALRLLPGARWLALTVAAFVAFLPQHLAILGSINNDSLAELLIAGILFILVGLADRGRTVRRSEMLLLGILLGLGYVTKGTVYPLTAVVGIVLLWRYWQQWRLLWRAALPVAVPALALGALWWGRNVAVYGGIDVLGKAAHDAVVVGQPRTAEWVAQFGLQGTVTQFMQTTFRSFWGQFGWMTVPMTYPGWLYPLLWLFSLAALGGLVLAAVRREQQVKRMQVLVLLLTFLLILGVHVVYNFTFVQHQGRYLFPALIPIGVGMGVGLSVWLGPLRKRWPRSVYLLPLFLTLGLVLLDLYALFRVIVPALG